MLSIQSAFNAYLMGDLGPWDVQAIVEANGYAGWECKSDLSIKLYSADFAE